MAESKKLTKEEAFCEEFIIDLNGTQAAIRAGYAEKSAKVTASRLLTKANVQKKIAELSEARSKRTEIDADYVLKRLVEIDQMDVLDILSDSGELLPVRNWPLCWRTTLSGMDVSEISTPDGPAALLKKIKWPDKVKNLELLGRHIKVQAFKDQTETSGSMTIEHKTLDDFYSDEVKR